MLEDLVRIFMMVGAMQNFEEAKDITYVVRGYM